MKIFISLALLVIYFQSCTFTHITHKDVTFKSIISRLKKWTHLVSASIINLHRFVVCSFLLKRKKEKTWETSFTAKQICEPVDFAISLGRMMMYKIMRMMRMSFFT